MVAFFAAVNHLSGPLRKQKFTSMGSKGHVTVTCGVIHYVCFLFAGCVGCHRNFDWRQRKTPSLVGFWTSEFACYWKVQWKVWEHVHFYPPPDSLSLIFSRLRSESVRSKCLILPIDMSLICIIYISLARNPIQACTRLFVKFSNCPNKSLIWTRVQIND